MNNPSIKDRSFSFALRIVNLCKCLDQTPRISRNLGDQLIRSGTSIGANVAEAQAAQSKKDFIAKMSIASKEARETSYWIQLLIAAKILPEAKLDKLADESEQLVAILTSIVKTSQKNLKSASNSN